MLWRRKKADLPGKTPPMTGSQGDQGEKPRRAYLFYGEESYLRQTYVQQLQELLIAEGSEEFNLHRLSGSRITAQDVIDAVETMPMMAPSTMVTVTDWDIFKLDEVERRPADRPSGGSAGLLHGAVYLRHGAL